MRKTIATLLLLAPLTALAQSSYHERQAEIRQRFDAEAARNQSYWQQHEQREQHRQQSYDRMIERNMQRDQHRERMDLLRQNSTYGSENHPNW